MKTNLYKGGEYTDDLALERKERCFKIIPQKLFKYLYCGDVGE